MASQCKANAATETYGLAVSGASGGVVVPFPGRLRFAYRMGVRERVDACEWADAAYHGGIARVVFHTGHAGDEPANGDFLLIYERGAEWASWGVAPDPAGFSVWRASTGVTLGCFATLKAALAAVMDGGGLRSVALPIC